MGEAGEDDEDQRQDDDNAEPAYDLVDCDDCAIYRRLTAVRPELRRVRARLNDHREHHGSSQISRISCPG